MIVPNKKEVLRELTLALTLMLDFNPDTTPYALMARIRAKAASVIKEAAYYTGAIAGSEVQAFLAALQLDFSIDCGADIVAGDMIRFTEDIIDYRTKPPRNYGKRMLTAEVLGIRQTGDNPMLDLRVIACKGSWKADSDRIPRTLKLIRRGDVRRVVWEDEAKRGGAGLRQSPGAALKVSTAELSGHNATTRPN